MKATIDELGMLSIKAENPLESYAIQKWADQNMGENGIVDGRNLTICFGKDNYTVETPKKSHLSLLKTRFGTKEPYEVRHNTTGRVLHYGTLYDCQGFIESYLEHCNS